MSQGSNTSTRSGARRNSDFLSDLSAAVRENPIPAALVGMGVLWLFSGGNKTTLGGGGTSLFGALRSGAASAAGAGFRGTAAVGSSIAHTAGSAASAAGHAASAAGETIGKAWDSAAEGAADLSHSARDTAKQMTDDARHGAPRDWAGSVQSTLTEAFTRQPLLLGAIGLGIGAAMAAAAPLTDVENDLMGDRSDALKTQARAATSSLADEAKERAGRAVSEAQAQGLTPQGAGQALRQAANTAIDVAEKTISGKIVPLSPD